MDITCKNCGAGINAVNISGGYVCSYCGTVYGATAKDTLLPETENTPEPPVPEFRFQYVPSRGEIFKNCFFLGLLLWVLWGFIRACLPLLLGKQYEVDANYTDTIFYSHVGSFYYVLRAVILLVIFPLFMCTIMYNKLVAKYRVNSEG